jgi:hypothetical protein
MLKFQSCLINIKYKNILSIFIRLKVWSIWSYTKHINYYINLLNSRIVASNIESKYNMHTKEEVIKWVFQKKIKTPCCQSDAPYFTISTKLQDISVPKHTTTFRSTCLQHTSSQKSN